MNVEAMRSEILKMYPGPNWKYKVSNMRESQVMAVYYSMRNRNQKPVKDKVNRKQMTIFDYDEEGKPKR